MTEQYHYQGIDYRWRLTREKVDQVLHYTHWIPNTKGFTRTFFATNYPGEDLGRFMAVFKAAGIRLNDGRGAPHGGRCHWGLKHLYFTDATSFAVEWDDTVTEDDGSYFPFGSRTTPPSGRRAATVDITPSDLTDIDALTALVTRILTDLGPPPPQG